MALNTLKNNEEGFLVTHLFCSDTITMGITTKDIIALLIKEVVRLYGFPSSIVLDRDKIFMSSFWSELLKQHGITLKISSAYHPQSDGQTKVVNKCLENYLRCLTDSKPKRWLTLLS